MGTYYYTKNFNYIYEMVSWVHAWGGVYHVCKENKRISWIIKLKSSKTFLLLQFFSSTSPDAKAFVHESCFTLHSKSILVDTMFHQILYLDFWTTLFWEEFSVVFCCTKSVLQSTFYHPGSNRRFLFLFWLASRIEKVD